MHVDFFEWDEEDFERGNTRYILSAGYSPEEIEDAILGHRGPIRRTRQTNRPMIDADIDGNLTRIIFEIDADGDLVVVTPITAFPVED